MKSFVVRAGMAIPASFFGKQCNQFGMSEDIWQGCLSCSSPFGGSTRVAGLSPFDQLEDFRNATLSQTILVQGGTCRFVQGYPASVASPNFSASQFTLDCGLAFDNATLSIELDGRSFGLKQWRNISAMEIVAASLVIMPMSGGNLVVSINATNISESSNYIIKPMFCCYLRDTISSCFSNISMFSPSQSLSFGDLVHITATISVANASLLPWVVGCQVQVTWQPEEKALAVVFVPVFRDDKAASPSNAISPIQGNEALIGNFRLTFVSSSNSLNTSDVHAIRVR